MIASSLASAPSIATKDNSFIVSVPTNRGVYIDYYDEATGEHVGDLVPLVTQIQLDAMQALFLETIKNLTLSFNTALSMKADSSSVYSKTEVYNKNEVLSKGSVRAKHVFMLFACLT